MSIKNVLFIFVNYNDSATTLNCIDSINKMAGTSSAIKIIIIDNASRADDFHSLEEKVRLIKNTALYRSEQNLGYFGGLNMGISKVGLIEGSYAVIGNNDLIFPPDFLESVQNKADLFESFPVVSPNIITLDGIHQNPHVIKSISPFRELVYDLYFKSYYLALSIKIIARITKSFTDRKDELQHNVAQTIYQGYGACYILGPLFFKHFDRLWAPTFLMGEELFLSKQIESKGLKLFYEPSIVVNHCLHATMGKLPGRRKWEIERESHKKYREYVKIWQ